MKKYLLSIIAILFVSALSAQSQDYNMDDKIPMYDEVLSGELENGVKYFIRENGKPENRAELQILVKAGSLMEEDDQAGLAHFLEHMAFNGTKNFPKNELIEFLESTGVRFGADLNANTGFERTYYMLTVQLDKEGMLDNGFQVLEDWAHNISFDPEEIEKERGVIMSEWRVYRGASERVMKQHYPKLLYKSRYAERLPIGDTAVIQNAPRERFLAFYNDWYRPELISVIAVGDFDKYEIEKKIKAHFNRIKQNPDAPEHKEYPIPYHKDALVSVATDKELTYSSVGIYFKHDGRDISTYGAYRQSIVDGLFSSMITQRLQEYLQKPDNPFMFYAGASEGSFIGPVRSMSFNGIIKADRAKDALDILLKEAFRVYQHGFTDTELERAKKEMLRGMEKAYEERDKTESRLYAMEFYRHCMEGESVPGIEKELELYRAWLPKIKLEEVNSLATKYIRKENLVITVSAQEDPEIPVPTEDEVMAQYNEISAMDLQPYEDIATDKPLMEKAPFPGRIIKETKDEELDITEMKLSNGAKVILKHTDFKNDQVLFGAYSYGGHSLYSDDEYFDVAASSSIIDKAGISEFDNITLNKMLSDKIVSVSPYISDVYEGFRGSYSPRDAETFFQLLHLYFTKPRKDEDAYKTYQQEMIAAISSQNKSPRTALSDTFQVTLYDYATRSLPITEERVNNIDFDRVYEVYKERFSDAGDFNFFFVGNYDEAKIRDYVQKYIASLPSKNSKENWKDYGVKYAKGHHTKKVKKGIEPKATLRMAIVDDFEYTRENRQALRALREVLNIRLREVIREDSSGVYGIGVWERTNKYPKENYTFNLTYTTSPERVDNLLKAVYEVFDEVKKGEFDKKYIDKVKEIWKNEHDKNIKENDYWLGTLMAYDRNNEDMHQILEWKKYMDMVDKQLVVEAANKYLKDDNVVKVYLYPEK